MWKRSELKQRGKKAFFANYWKTVLISYLLTLIVGGMGAAGGFSSGFSNGFSSVSNVIEQKFPSSSSYIEEDSGNSIDGMTEEEIKNAIENDMSFLDQEWNGSSDEGSISKGDSAGVVVAIIVVGLVFAIVFMVFYLVCLAISFALSAFLLNPLQLGTTKFFVTNLDEKAAVKHMGYGFDSNYKNVVLTMFKQMIYTFLWSLLFVIPGIIKGYAYRMVPYILAENPNMKSDEVLALSSKMMYGQKWKAFVLDLSFLGWHILSAMTGGILGTFYVNPYQNMTNAALYEALKENTPVAIEAPVYGMNAGEA